MFFSDQIPFCVCFVVHVCEGMDHVKCMCCRFYATGHINVQMTTTMDKRQQNRQLAGSTTVKDLGFKITVANVS